MCNEKILIVAAHPDDEILGCGGTVAKMIKQGAKAYSLILGEGKSSRNVDAEEIKLAQSRLREEGMKANCHIGIKNVRFMDLPDNKFDEVPLLEIVKKIEDYIDKIKPDIVFTHYRNDLNIDHRITYDAVLTATRPMQEQYVKSIYSFEVLSSTEWNYPLDFSPNVFVDITDTLQMKLDALNEYSSEMREYPHPRSLLAVERNAEMWGIKCGIDRAEAFVLVRDIMR